MASITGALLLLYATTEDAMYQLIHMKYINSSTLKFYISLMYLKLLNVVKAVNN